MNNDSIWVSMHNSVTYVERMGPKIRKNLIFFLLVSTKFSSFFFDFLSFLGMHGISKELKEHTR